MALLGKLIMKLTHLSVHTNDIAGEMHLIPAGPQSWCNLDRSSGVAYAAQESWVQNETIRKNILFGERFDETRYKKGVCLEPDPTVYICILIESQSCTSVLSTKISNCSAQATSPKSGKKVLL